MPKVVGVFSGAAGDGRRRRRVGEPGGRGARRRGDRDSRLSRLALVDALEANVELASHLMKRRAALRLMGQGAALVALAACGPAAPPAPTVSVAAPTSAPAQPAATTAPQGTPAAAAAQGTPAATRKTGGTLRVGVPADISSLDGHTSSSLLSITQSHGLRSPGRLRRQGQRRRPMLAESWEVVARLQAGQAQPPQGRAVAQRARVHQRRRQVEPAARAGPQGRDWLVRQPGQLVPDDRHARQVHGRPASPTSRGRPSSTTSTS